MVNLQHLLKLTAHKGQGFDIATSLDNLILDAGFEKVGHEEFKVSLGIWAADKKQKELGAFTLLTTEHGFESHGMALLTRTLGMEASKASELIVGAKKESRSKRVHSYSVQYVFMTPSWILELICSKTGTCTTLRNPSKRVISSDHV